MAVIKEKIVEDFAVNYHLRDELLNLYVCLYNPYSEELFSIETLNNYILDCAYQIENNEQIKRFPFQVSPSKVNAQKAVEKMRQTIQATRKDVNQPNQNFNEKGKTKKRL